MSTAYPGEPASEPRGIFPSSPGGAWLADVRLPPPERHDHVIFLRGLPVAPWMRLRPWAEVWGVWLAHLEALFQVWQMDLQPDARMPAEAAPAAEPPSPPRPVHASGASDDWDAWREFHIHSVEMSGVEVGLATLLALVQRLERDGPEGALHLIGHSVGGAVVVAYLAGLRARVHAAPQLPLRAALTLDAAVSGLAGVWSGAKSYLHRITGNHVMAEGLRGMHGWAAERGTRLLTASNQGDLWSHKRLADIPYLGVRLGSRLALRDQINGSIHDWLRRTPEFVQAIWGPLPAEPLAPPPPLPATDC